MAHEIQAVNCVYRLRKISPNRQRFASGSAYGNPLGTCQLPKVVEIGAPVRAGRRPGPVGFVGRERYQPYAELGYGVLSVVRGFAGLAPDPERPRRRPA